MKRYTKTIDGKTVIEERNRIVINKDGTTTLFPTHEMLLEDGWVEYTIPEPTEEELFARAKRNLKNEINHYDSSSEVNEFYIQDIPVWLDKATRSGLLLRLMSEEMNEETTTTLWYNNMQFPLSIEDAKNMLYAIERYASACYDNTQTHLAAIESLTTIDEIEAYNYRTGYPEKIHF